MTIPTLVAVAWRESAPFGSDVIGPALTDTGTRRIVVEASELRKHDVDRYPYVARWLIELDMKGMPLREIGLNQGGHPLYRAPGSSERGVFAGSNVTLGTNVGTAMTSDEFESIWARAPAR